MYYNDVVKYGLPILILVVGGGITYLLTQSYEKPDREDPEPPSSIVETRRVERQKHRLDIRGSGTVVPARQVRITPQVSGKLVDINEELVPGGVVDKGDELLQIEGADYRVAVDQAKQALKQAEAQLAIEKGQSQVAKEEWEFFKQNRELKTSSKSSSLALRKPQLKSARSRVENAKAQLEQARINLRRTRIKAPFDGVVLEESAEIGQLVGPNSPVATIVGTDAFWVKAAIDTEYIDDLKLPKRTNGEASRVKVTYDLGNRKIEKQGRVLRLLGDITQEGRMARVLIRLPDPLARGSDGTQSASKGRIPLLINAFVDVKIEGRREEKLIEVPRVALHNGNEVYTYADGELAIKEVNVVWRRPSTVLVDSGLKDGDRVIISPLANPIEGLALKLASESKSPTEDGEQ